MFSVGKNSNLLALILKSFKFYGAIFTSQLYYDIPEFYAEKSYIMNKAMFI